MTESNFAASSARAAWNMVLTVSTIRVCSAVSIFCWAPAVEILPENISAKAMMAPTTLSDDMEASPNYVLMNRHAGVLFIPLQAHCSLTADASQALQKPILDAEVRE